MLSMFKADLHPPHPLFLIPLLSHNRTFKKKNFLGKTSPQFLDSNLVWHLQLSPATFTSHITHCSRPQGPLQVCTMACHQEKPIRDIQLLVTYKMAARDLVSSSRATDPYGTLLDFSGHVSMLFVDKLAKNKRGAQGERNFLFKFPGEIAAQGYHQCCLHKHQHR